MIPITPEEINKTLNYLELASMLLRVRERNVLTNRIVEQPVNTVAQFLLENFGWSLSTGRERAKLILEQLKQDKFIEFLHDRANRLRAVKLNSLYIVSSSDLPKPRLVQIVQINKSKDQALTPPSLSSFTPTARKKIKIRKKGVARRLREKVIIGDRAENRFHNICLNLAGIIKQNRLGNFSSLQVSRSGHHNPNKGRVDERDRSGDDVALYFTSVQCGKETNHFIIYDVKNSSRSAEVFNRKIRKQRYQAGALLKKAIASSKKRSDQEIIDEILDDMISVGLLTLNDKDRIIGYLPDF